MKQIEYMNMQEDLKANAYSFVVGTEGTPLGEAFTGYIEKFGILNIRFICSLCYNLGKMHGKREERARRKLGLSCTEKCRTEPASKANKDTEENELDKLRKNICDLSSKIRSERRLRQIFTIAHRAFLNDRMEALNER